MKKFEQYAMNEKNERYQEFIKRTDPIYKKEDEIRSEFDRDYTRVLHSLAYRRLKHKTQVFFNIGNDHICTRMEHVSHVESVSYTIAKALGLNTELTKAISMGHDLGHAPFGHQGESILNELSQKYLEKPFWHERNGLRFVDDIELLEDPDLNYSNLNLTYAVRDGIVSHCGEVDEQALKPREELIDLSNFVKGKYSPATWEACIVKIADKIAYLGRDIDDAFKLKFISEDAKKNLMEIANRTDKSYINTTGLMHGMILDICKNSSPEVGICLGEKKYNLMMKVKEFNYTNIYGNPRLEVYKKYSRLVIEQIFDALYQCFEKQNTFKQLDKMKLYYPKLMGGFYEWIKNYTDIDMKDKEERYINKKVYTKLENKKIYAQAIIDYISGMTDSYAIMVFNELITY